LICSKLIAIFKDITDYSYKNENPGVIRYVTLIPTDASDETSVYMLEQYKDQAALDAHLSSAPVQKLLKFFGDESPIVGAPEVHNLTPSIDFRRPITDPKPGMLFLFAHMVYKEGKISEGLSILQELVSAVEKLEPEFYGCTTSVDKEKNLIRIVDMFESEKFYEEEHVKSAPIAKFHGQNAPLATGEFGFAKLKVVQGFLGR
jgi:quinol monooxygenase YgiN